MKNSLLETGEVVSTHGIHGELKIYPWADGPEFLQHFKRFRIGNTDYCVSSCRVQKTCVLLKLKDIDTIETAQPLIGKTVYIYRDDYTPDRGWFIADLIGLDVRADGHVIGKLTDVIEMPANGVWEVKGEKTYLIPAVPEFILNVDINSGIVEVRLLEGMAEDEN